MSATEWKFVPVEPTREMLVAALKTNGACPIYAAMLDAAPVPPSVESLLENWTPSDQQAFAKFRDEHFPGEMSSYAIQSLGSAWKDGQANAVAPNSAPGTGSDALDCILGVGGFASFGPLDAQPAAHLTIPGALEWDGDNGTHGVVGTHSADGESLADHSGDTNEKAVPAAWKITYADDGELHRISLSSVQAERLSADSYYKVIPLYAELPAPVSAYTAVDMTTAAAGGFRDGQTAATESLKAFANELIAAAFEGGSFDGGDIQDIAVKHGLLQIEQRTEECGEVCACREYGFPAECYRKTDLLKPADEPVIEPAALDDIPDFTPGNGNKAKRRIAAIEKAKAEASVAGCAYEVGDWACREGGYLWYAGDGEGWDPEDCTHICPHCRTKDYLESAKEEAESCSSYSNNGSSGTGLDIWTAAEKLALTANHPAASKALAEIGPVSALDGGDVVICNTQKVAP